MTELPENLETILHIGAGYGEELPSYLDSDAKRILLVEPSSILADSLRRRAAQDGRVQVLEVAVTTDPSLNQLNEYNLPEAASLYRPTGLRDLFPGLRITAQHQVDTQTPEQLLAQFPLKGERNLLVLETPGAEQTILKALAEAKLLDNISHIWLTCPRNVYYESASRATDALAELERAGYQIKAEHHSQTDWPQWHLACNPMARQAQALELEKQELTTRLENAMQHSSEMDNTVAKLQEREVELGAALNQANSMATQLRKELAEIREKFATTGEELKQTKAGLSKLKNEAEEAKQQLEQEQQTSKAAQQQQQKLKEQLDAERAEHSTTQEELQKHKTYLANRKKQVEEAEQQNQFLEQQNQTLQQQLKEQGDNAKRFEQLQAQLATVTQNITQNVNSHMDRKLERNSEQLENTLALQGYLQNGNLPMKQVGTALSAQLALYVAEKIETSQYDLIIEFGSGASTGFLARTVLKRATRHHNEQKQLGYNGESQNGKELAFVTPDDDDLPKRIISFEHRKEQHAKLEQVLATNGLQQVVELVHAPLIDYRHQGQDYLHYGCDSTLEQITRLYEGRTAKFLILVNGPPSKTGPNARFPALPKLLNALGNHTIDVVLSDTLREEAHTITERWSTLLEQRGIAFRKEIIDLEKGATLMAINNV
ncbi:hypothetical protein [Marinimicrobium agarilyticum]|uniref:hypothetical protein n=1 Tax=Marinimicrobium agarilyticum TaxID=306546 RepID=UPI0003F8F574|nr:hypothetical protein [Marinimicrobium agarilyticum]